ncbi:hypothetical protein PCE1_003326 [Barthelona sp. PCE]
MTTKTFFKFREDLCDLIELENNSISIPSKDVLDFGFDKVFVDDPVGISDTIAPALGDNKSFCFIAVGATSSGKTHLLLGEKHKKNAYRGGVLQTYLINELLKDDVCIDLSVIEIYKTNKHDLLKPRKHSKMTSNTPSTTAIRRPPGVNDEELTTMIGGLLNQILRHRRTSKTAANAQSSRSHLIIMARTRPDLDDEEELPSLDTFEEGEKFAMFLDLAGNERHLVSKTSGSSLEEGIKINTDTLFFFRMLRNMKENFQNSKPVICRDTVLTHFFSETMQKTLQTLDFYVFGCGRGDEENLSLTANTIRNSSLSEGLQHIQSIPSRVLPNAQNERQIQGAMRTLMSENRTLQQRISTTEAKLEEMVNHEIVNDLHNQIEGLQKTIVKLRQDLHDRDMAAKKDKENIEILEARIDKLVTLNKHYALNQDKQISSRKRNATEICDPITEMPRSLRKDRRIFMSTNEGGERMTFHGVASPSVSGNGTTVVFDTIKVEQTVTTNNKKLTPIPSKHSQAHLQKVLDSVISPQNVQNMSKEDLPFSPDERFEKFADKTVAPEVNTEPITMVFDHLEKKTNMNFVENEQYPRIFSFGQKENDEADPSVFYDGKHEPARKAMSILSPVKDNDDDNE